MAGQTGTDTDCQILAIHKVMLVIEFNLEGIVLTANENFLKTFGYSLEEIRGKHHSMFVQETYKQSSEYKEFWAKLSRGEYQAAEYKRIGKDSREVWIQASYNPICDLNGNPFRVVKYATDVTARKKSEDDLARMQANLLAVIENTQDIVWSVDCETRLLTFNTSFRKQYEKLLGQSPTIGMNPKEDFSRSGYHDLIDRFRALYHRALSGESTHEELSLPNQGSVVYLDISVSPIKTGNRITGVAAVGRDITERRLMEQSVRRAHDELEFRVVQRTAELAEANERLRVMAGGIAHQLNQPLTAIVNYAKGCHYRLGQSIEERSEILWALDEIASESLRAGRLIKGLRSLVSGRAPEMKSTSVNEIVLNAATISKPLIQEMNGTIEYCLAEGQAVATLDGALVTQVVINLIHNALDAMRNYPLPERILTLETFTSTKNFVQVTVRDRGIGIPVEKVANVFAPFNSSKPGGMGLGLTICRNIVELHGGQIWLDTQLGVGTSFHFTLPISAQEDLS